MSQPHYSSNQVTGKSSTRRIQVLVILIIIIGLVAWASWKLFQGIVSPDVLSAVGAAIIAGLAIAYGKVQEKKKDIEQQLREKKILVYEEFVQICFRCIATVKAGKFSDSQATFDSELRNFIQKMIVWASDDVMVAFAKWSQLCGGPSDSTSTAAANEMMLAFEQLLLVIRKDLGHENKNLQVQEGDLLRLIMNYLDQHPALEQENTEEATGKDKKTNS